jgi:hypothetical protein
VRRAVLAALIAVLLATPMVHAAPSRPGGVVTTTIGSLYAPYTVVVPAGSQLRLVQLDPALRHDVVSRYAIRGRPMFATDGTLAFGEIGLVAGVETLRPAFYPFTCSIHPEMFGQLVVR